MLESQLSELQERLGEVEREREVLAMQHHSSVQQHSHSLTSIEKVSIQHTCAILYPPYTQHAIFARSW